MTLADYRARNRRRSFPVLELLSTLLIVAASLMLGLELVDYSEEADSLGEDVTIAEVQVGGLAESERIERLESVYLQQPIFLRYEGNPIQLFPSEIGFVLDTDGMQAEASRLNTSDDNFWAGFWNFLQREPQPPIEVELIADYSEVELRSYLEDLGNRYNATTEGPGFDLVTLTFSGTGSNTQLDIEAAIPLIEDALYETSQEARTIDLPTQTIQGQAPTMDTLRQALINFMEAEGVFYDGTTTKVSVFVMDLSTGEEMGIQENMRHSAVSTIKLGVLINYFRDKITTPPDDEKYLLAASVICSENSATNLLMEITSDDNTYADGPRNTTETMCELGASESSIRSMLFVGTAEQLRNAGTDPAFYYAPVAVTPCPASTVEPFPEAEQVPYDSFNYTTAADMGTMLMMTYDCAMNGSGLSTVFPDEITQTECQQILEVMRGTNFERFSELGAPEDVEISHKVGYAVLSGIGGTVGDVAIVYSPATDYVFTVYIWEELPPTQQVTDIRKWSLIDDMSRVVYNYFNPDQPLLETRQPLNPNGGVECVLPQATSDVNLNDINDNRFDENGDPVDGSCYGFPNCRPFDNWGQN